MYRAALSCARMHLAVGLLYPKIIFRNWAKKMLENVINRYKILDDTIKAQLGGNKK